MARRAATGRFLALDFGTSGVRASVGGATGPPLSVARRPVSYFRPAGAPDTALEFDPEGAWHLATEAAAEALWLSGADKDGISGVGVTSQRHGLVLLDGSGKELYAGPNKDLRGVFQGGVVDAAAGDCLWDLTGHGPGFMTAWARLLWMKEEARETYEQISAVCGIADWLAYRLSGELRMNSSLAPELGLAMTATGEPAEAIGRALGLDVAGFPPRCEPGEVIGEVCESAAGEMGLRKGTPLVSAGPDTQVALAGMGVSECDDAGVAAGWSGTAQRVSSEPVFDSSRTLWTGRHVVPDRWTLEGNAGEMGGAYEWLASMLCGSDGVASAMSRLDAEAGAVEPGSRGAAAYLGPSLLQMEKVGMKPGGLIFPVPLSFEPPDRGSLARAALESFAFAVQLNLERMGEYCGAPIRSVSVGGGMTRSATFLEVLCNVAAAPVYACAGTEPSSLGTLTLTGAAVEDGQGLEAGLRVRRDEMLELRSKASLREEYRDLYEAWRERERQVSSLFF